MQGQHLIIYTFKRSRRKRCVWKPCRIVLRSSVRPAEPASLHPLRTLLCLQERNGLHDIVSWQYTPSCGAPAAMMICAQGALLICRASKRICSWDVRIQCAILICIATRASPYSIAAPQNADLVQEWAMRINMIIRTESQRPTNLLVILNPFGGARRARKIWRKKAQPVFSLAGAPHWAFV